MKKLLLALALSITFIVGITMFSSNNAYADETLDAIDFDIVLDSTSSEIKYSIVLNNKLDNIKSGNIVFSDLSSFDIDGNWSSSISKDIATFDENNQKGAFAFSSCETMSAGTIFTFTVSPNASVDSTIFKVGITFKTKEDGVEKDVAYGENTALLVSNTNLNGLKKLVDNKTYYIVSGKIQDSFTGFVKNASGTWYVESGILDYNVNGLFTGTYNGQTKTGVVSNGKVVEKSTLIVKSGETLYVGADGFVDYSFNGFVVYSSRTFKVTNGKVTYNESGLGKIGNDTYYYADSEITYSHNGFFKVGNDYYYVVNSKVTKGPLLKASGSATYYVNANGKVDYSFTGFVADSSGIWYVQSGKVNTSVTNVVEGTYKGVKKYGYVVKGKIQAKANIIFASSGTWYVGKDGFVDTTFNGLASTSTTKYKFKNGKVTYKENGLIYIDGKYYNIESSKVKVGPLLKKNGSTTYYIDAYGKVDYSFTGFVSDSTGTWYVKSGKVATTTTGVVYGKYNGVAKYGHVINGKLQKKITAVKYSNGFWYIGADGFVNYGYNGLAFTSVGTYKIKNGKVDTGYSGILTVSKTTYKVTGGKVTYNDNGIIKVGSTYYYFVKSKVKAGPALVKSGSTTYYVNASGKVDFTYTNIFSNSSGKWYVKSGKVQTSYTGKITIKGKTYNVVKGKVK